MTVDRTITNSVGSDSEMLDELRKIRALLEPKPAPPAPPPPKGFVKEFKMFLEQYKVMGMAVAFILGLYLGTLVQSLVTNLIMPIIDIVLPGIAWQNIHSGPFLIGSFLGALVTFLIIALVIFLLVKITSKLGIK
ncbi:MAG: MscL family protein [Candidatus Thermoplasmatota archaeon]|jgi:large conductance mechanosensitive channel|nr:MscL family protein [Candidatus Thermoplasmatota archaeon]MCL5930304.1 MscL family protein [Candidatus Thermoplasmatota archaeon]